jgi:hypothetical protein
MDRKEFENFMSIFNRTSVFESWGSYARVSGNASLEDEKNKFGSFQLTYPDAIAILAAPPFFVRSRPVRLSLPNLPSPPPLHSLDSRSLFLSCYVCAYGLSGVIVSVCCSCSCFRSGREKRSKVLVFVPTCSLWVAVVVCACSVSKSMEDVYCKQRKWEWW